MSSQPVNNYKRGQKKKTVNRKPADQLLQFCTSA